MQISDNILTGLYKRINKILELYGVSDFISLHRIFITSYSINIALKNVEYDQCISKSISHDTADSLNVSEDQMLAFLLCRSICELLKPHGCFDSTIEHVQDVYHKYFDLISGGDVEK